MINLSIVHGILNPDHNNLFLPLLMLMTMIEDAEFYVDVHADDLPDQSQCPMVLAKALMQAI